MDEKEFSKRISDLLMGRIVEILCVAAGDEAQRGERFIIHLGGDLSGSWLLDLQPGAVRVERTREPDTAVEASADWQLSYAEVSKIITGSYSFAQARKEKRLVPRGDRAAALKLERMLDAISRVDLLSCLQNPTRYLAKRFRAGVVAGEAKTGKKKRAHGVQIRK